jgi:HSP20 family molecular chaperone IbpA
MPLSSSGWSCPASTSSGTSPSRSGTATVVRGERRDERTEERGGRSLPEVRYGSFRRSFGLPAHAGADAVTGSR